MTHREKLAVIESKIDSFSGRDKEFWEDIIKRVEEGSCSSGPGEAIIIEFLFAKLEKKVSLIPNKFGGMSF